MANKHSDCKDARVHVELGTSPLKQVSPYEEVRITVPYPLLRRDGRSIIEGC